MLTELETKEMEILGSVKKKRLLVSTYGFPFKIMTGYNLGARNNKEIRQKGLFLK